MSKFLTAVLTISLVAAPMVLVPEVAHAKTEKQLRDEAKGKAAKQKSAEKSAARKAAHKKSK